MSQTHLVLRLGGFALAALLCLSLAPRLAAAGAILELNFSVSNTTPSVGQTTNVVLTIQGLGNMAQPSINSWSLFMGFPFGVLGVLTPEVLSTIDPTTAVDQLDPLGTNPAPVTLVPGTNFASLGHTALALNAVLDANQVGSFVMLTFALEALAVGMGDVFIGGSVTDTTGQVFATMPVAGEMQLNLGTSPIKVTVVPEPGSALLVSVGLAGLALIGRRRDA